MIGVTNKQGIYLMQVWDTPLCDPARKFPWFLGKDENASD